MSLPYRNTDDDVLAIRSFGIVHYVFPLLGGLRAIHLPGHTAGHTGYFCESRGWLFSCDLFASFGPFSHRPPVFFNENSASARRSIDKALSLDLRGVLPHHCRQASPEAQLERLRRLGTTS